jgi:hypothetical protein
MKIAGCRLPDAAGGKIRSPASRIREPWVGPGTCCDGAARLASIDFSHLKIAVLSHLSVD